MPIYGYARISRKSQNIERQIRNIKGVYPDAVIIQEVYTRTSMDREKWAKLYKKVGNGDIIVFDSVSRMSGNADDIILKNISFDVDDTGHYLGGFWGDSGVHG